MSQCDIRRLRGSDDLVCVVQSDLGVETAYVLIAPVLTKTEWPVLVPRLHIEFAMEGVTHVVLMSQMVAIPRKDLGAVIGSADPIRDQMIAAVDLLVSGF